MQALPPQPRKLFLSVSGPISKTGVEPNRFPAASLQSGFSQQKKPFVAWVRRWIAFFGQANGPSTLYVELLMFRDAMEIPSEVVFQPVA